MRQTTLRLSDIALIGGTRVALGAGIGLLLGRKLDENVRRGAGWALFAVGLISTVPLFLNVLANRAAAAPDTH
jgi:hypothetical protein